MENFKNLPESEFENFVTIPKIVYDEMRKSLRNSCIVIHELENESPAIKRWCANASFIVQDYSVYFHEDCLDALDVFLEHTNNHCNIFGQYLANFADIRLTVLIHLLINYSNFINYIDNQIHKCMCDLEDDTKLTDQINRYGYTIIDRDRYVKMILDAIDYMKENHPDKKEIIDNLTKIILRKIHKN